MAVGLGIAFLKHESFQILNPRSNRELVTRQNFRITFVSWRAVLLSFLQKTVAMKKVLFLFFFLSLILLTNCDGDGGNATQAGFVARGGQAEHLD
ncbi:MAG: hypothetical protein ACE5EY_17305, partial [Anaerolineae bacterium]